SSFAYSKVLRAWPNPSATAAVRRLSLTASAHVVGDGARPFRREHQRHLHERLFDPRSHHGASIESLRLEVGQFKIKLFSHANEMTLRTLVVLRTVLNGPRLELLTAPHFNRHAR